MGILQSHAYNMVKEVISYHLGRGVFDPNDDGRYVESLVVVERSMMNKRVIYQDIEATNKKNREHKDTCAEVKQVRKPVKEVSK